MGKLVYLIFGAVLSSAAKKIFVGAGLGLVSAYFFYTIINMYIDRAISSISQTDNSYIGLLHIAGVDHALSVIIGALICRAVISSMQVSISKT